MKNVKKFKRAVENVKGFGGWDLGGNNPNMIPKLFTTNKKVLKKLVHRRD